jgi:hypothetical protein
MTNIHPALPQHRRARLIAWTLAMLAWLAGVLTGNILKPRHARQRAERASLWFLARRVHLLIICRAMDLVGRRPLRFSGAMQRGRSIAQPGLMRALIGAKLRRAFKKKSALDSIFAMIHALRNLDAFARTMAQRIRRKLTRRLPKAYRPVCAEPVLALGVCDVRFADSS